MEVNVGKKKKGKTWRNEVDTKTVKIATLNFPVEKNNTDLGRMSSLLPCSVDTATFETFSPLFKVKKLSGYNYFLS